jgi:outer membrane protein
VPEVSVGVVLSWRFWQWGKVYYGVYEAKAKLAAEAGIESLKRAIELEVKQALLAINLVREEIKIQQEALEAAEEQIRIEERFYDAQSNTSTEVLDATSRLVEAQVQLASFQYEYFVKFRQACVDRQFRECSDAGARRRMGISSMPSVI